MFLMSTMQYLITLCAVRSSIRSGKSMEINGNLIKTTVKMKHPFQTLAASPDGKIIYAAAKNQVQSIDVSLKSKLAQWEDKMDTVEFLTQQKRRKLEKENKTNEPVVVPKIPVPGPGAPPANNYIRALSVSPNGKYVVATTDTDKSVVVFESSKSNSELEYIKRQPIPKRPCSIALTNETVLAADKFGDVYQIPYTGEVEYDDKELMPILGHVSMLTDVALAQHNDKQFILTADRDEHIRVLNYPKAYVAKGWLFGHNEYVLALCIDGDFLISGGGDDFLCYWNWYEAKLLGKFQLRDLLKPYFQEFHNVPERWATPESVPEISVSRIIKFGELVIVLVENVKCLLVLKVLEGQLELVQTLDVESPLVDIVAIPNAIIGAPEAGGLIKLVSDETQGKILVEEKWDVEGPETDDLSTLWYVNTLRKRSEH